MSRRERLGEAKMANYKRMSYGPQVVEWNDTELIARRYDVVDVTETLANKVTAKMIDERPITPDMVEKFQAAWIHYGKVIVTK